MENFGKKQQSSDLTLINEPFRELLGRRMETLAKRREVEAEIAKIDAELFRQGLDLGKLHLFCW